VRSLAASIRAARDPLARDLPGWVNALLIGATFVAVRWLERRRPLRRTVEKLPAHETHNLAMAALSAAAIRVAEKPLTGRLTDIAHRRRLGLVKCLRLPAALEVALTIVLLDYTLYVWHVLTHRAAILWRFHRVHHADLDLTASTALRFHFVEMILSVPWRLAQIVVIGAAPRSFSAWQTATLMAILFHHSNIALPLRVERWLCRIVMTPRMHGIHHSIVPDEANANWSTILAFPDYLHRTFRLNVPQHEVTIGVPEFRDPADLELADIIRMPFGEQRPFWRLPGDGTPQRTPLPPRPASTLAE
jgi:sterol desaturase/sphingolipid hydroxylase (fatty acid hydroxylase superfamily)